MDVLLKSFECTSILEVKTFVKMIMHYILFVSMVQNVLIHKTILIFLLGFEFTPIS